MVKIFARIGRPPSCALLAAWVGFLFPPGAGHAEVMGTTAFDVYRDKDAIHAVLEEERPEAPPRLFYRISRDGGRSFATPIPIRTKIPPLAGHRGADPQIAAFGSSLVVAWTSRGSGYGQRGKIGLARSLDGGKHWSAGTNPADDAGADGAHAFLALAFDSGARAHLVWLDERKGAMGLRAAYSDDTGKTWSTNRTIDPESCTCCPNALLSAEDRLFVLYRMAKPRDTALAASVNRGETWHRLGPVGAFSWEFLGCPHWGAGIASLGSGPQPSLCAAIETGKPGRAGVYFLQSSDKGRTWSAPRRFGTPTAKFVDLAATDGTLCAAWEDSGATSTQILATLSRDGGQSWDAPQKLSGDDIWATHPRVVGTGDGFLILWTETADSIHLRWSMARLSAR
ncbi:MAG: sialidase family protein [Methylacidiphilaceae bacterium]|nr:sialidase family protein [Candidatus Methylacidiphilaceae bacterium]